MRERRGVLVCAGSAATKNIGDYMQSLAAAQFAGPNAALIERERLNAYSGEPVKVVMNAWFMHHPERFPPSAAIHPLFLAFHLSPNVTSKFLTPDAVAYLKNHAPIGCRDEETMVALTRLSIPVTFTSCLTLTLGRSYRHRAGKGGKPVFVDPFFPRPLKGEPPRLFSRFLAILPYSLLNFQRIRPLMPKMRVLRLSRSRERFVRWIYAAEFHRAYSTVFSDAVLQQADYVSHDVPRSRCPTDEAFMAEADSLMKRYSEASFVVTSRLHCAFPCLAAEVPVWFVFDERIGKGRMGGNLTLLNVLRFGSDGRLVPPDEGKDPLPPVRRDHLRLAERLARMVMNFLGTEVS